MGNVECIIRLRDQDPYGGGRPVSTGNSEKQVELELRRQEVEAAVSNAKTQRFLSKFQLAAVVLSLFAVAAAGVATGASVYSVRQTAENNLKQAEDNQVSTAVNALGSDDSADRVAGLMLLRINAIRQIWPLPASRADRKEAYENYVMALVVLGSYIHNYSLSFISGKRKFGLGYGAPSTPGTPLDVTLAADEIRTLLHQRRSLKALREGVPSLDLSNDELFKQSWARVDFSWLANKYFVGIDLRGANLKDSQLRGADLHGSYLQCANLKGADLRGTDLTKADLRGANVQGAKLKNANLFRAQKQDLYGKAKGLPAGKSVASWQQSQASCLTKYEDNAPKAAIPTPSPNHKTGKQNG